MKKLLSIIISTILICCCVLGFIGCDKEKNKGNGGDNGGTALPVVYTVKFDLNGGSGSIDDQVIEEGGNAIKPDKPTRDGYDFDGWYTEPDGGKIWNFYLDAVTKDTTLYAHWSQRILDTKGLSFREIKEGENTVAYAVKGIVEAPDRPLVIPSEFNGLPVTRIDDYAFYENSDLISVTISGNITEIGDSAFYDCENLENLVIDAKITKMGDLAFAHCLKIQTLRIEDRVEEIGYYAFFECESIKEVTIPASVKSIGESAFAFCTGLEEVTLNEGLEYIGDCAFGGCTSLEEFVMPQSVTEIGFGVLMFVGGFFFDGEAYDSNNSVRKIVMSDNITDIPDFAFSGCVIPAISIGKKVETINYSAFYGCKQMESVVIPKSVKSIISYAFYQCYMLNTVYYEGTAEEWSGVSIGKYGNDISNAEVYFYCENTPQEEGNFWHFSSDGVTPVKW